MTKVRSAYPDRPRRLAAYSGGVAGSVTAAISAASHACVVASPAVNGTLGDQPSSAWARLMSEGAASGRPRNALDMIVAAVAMVNACVVVTDNERDFAGLNFINPMRQ